jgi:hypothetical protein
LGTRNASAVFYNDSLYLSDVSSGGVYSYAKFDNVQDSTIKGIVTDAAGIGYNFNNYVPSNNSVVAESADLSATVTTSSDIVTLIQGYDFSIANKVLSASEALSPTQLSNNLVAQNGNWIDTQITTLNIDSGLNLTAFDVDGCQINGTATNTGSGFFSFSVIYSACDFSGNYEGILQLFEVDEVLALSWMAFDSNSQGVFARVDNQVTQDEALSLTGKLIPSLYVSSSTILITKSDGMTNLDQIFTLEYTTSDNTNTPFVFQYIYDATQQLILEKEKGDGLPIDSIATNSALSIPVTTALERLEVSLEYENSNNNLVTKEYSALDYIPPDKLLDSIAGQWGQLIISDLGIVSGNVQDCSVDGEVSNDEGKLWDISITILACTTSNNSGDYSGVIVGAEGSVFGVQNDVVITSLFNADKTLGVNGILSRQ